MPYKYANELSFLTDVLGKSHLNVTVLSSHNGAFDLSSSDSPFPFGERPDLLKRAINPRTLYKVLDRFLAKYIFLILPDSGDSVLCIGPYLESEPTELTIEQIVAKNKTDRARARYLIEYYKSLPVLDERSPLLDVLNVFCERIWNGEQFTVQDPTKADAPSEAPFSSSMIEHDQDDTIVKIKAIERRYSFENEMIRAVSQGRSQAESLFSSSFSGELFEKRSADPVRNAKNYAIIMNTLLRKAAESGGVHPIHIDRVSSEFAARIESVASASYMRELMMDMFRTYCRLVRSLSLKSFSPLVQNAILIIEADLSADITPSGLAEKLSVSLGYLSTIFKKQTGKTICQYIVEKRMEYAKYILSTSSMQIQNVALHCGILDVQYFSKLFKKHTGKTPTEFRESAKKHTPR